jgi:ubiquinone/menaquinone biosynthesis C-methylase UbiE
MTADTPVLHAVPDGPDPALLDMKQKQAAYHDWEAQSYEDKFCINYDEPCIDYVRGRFDKVMPGPVHGRVLELGGGTGFFSINLALSGAITGELHVSDISPGMLEVCATNAAGNGVEVVTDVGDAEALPYPDDHFDLVMGHAFLHHLPVPGLAIREAFRVLRPGGRLLVAGEPTELGDRISRVVKHNTWRLFRAVTALPGMQRYRRADLKHGDASERDTIMARLEDEVDLWTFRPQDVAHMASLAGFDEVDVRTEELLANWSGWAVRTIEGSIADGTLGVPWYQFAFGSYQLLTAVDERIMRHVVPQRFFYNLLLTATKPV